MTTLNPSKFIQIYGVQDLFILFYFALTGVLKSFIKWLWIGLWIFLDILYVKRGRSRRYFLKIAAILNEAEICVNTQLFM